MFRALQDIFSSEGLQGLFRCVSLCAKEQAALWRLQVPDGSSSSTTSCPALHPPTLTRSCAAGCRGNGASVLRIVPYSALYMTCYERYRRALVDLRLVPTHPTSGRVSPLVDLLAGSSAGATAVVITYPLDLVRTRLAFMTEAAPAGAAGAAAASGAAGPLPNAAPARPPGGSCTASGGGGGAAYFRQLSRYQLPGLGGSLAGGTRGLTLTMTHARVPLSGSALQTAARHSAAGWGARRGLHAGGLGPLAAAVRHRHHRPTIAGVLRGTLAQEGLRGMYHGIGPSLYGILPYAGLKFYVYQHLKARFYTLFPDRMSGSSNNPRLPVSVMLSNGALAGLVAQTATYPLDVVRRRMQVRQGVGGLGRVFEGAARQPPLAQRGRPCACLLPVQFVVVRVGGMGAGDVFCLHPSAPPSRQPPCCHVLPCSAARLQPSLNAATTSSSQVEGLLQQQAAAAGQQQAGSAAPPAQSRMQPLVVRSTPAALLTIWRREGWRALFAGLSINYMKVGGCVIGVEGGKWRGTAVGANDALGWCCQKEPEGAWSPTLSTDAVDALGVATCVGFLVGRAGAGVTV